ncbi:MAG: hypothetical protein IT374_23335 [Polyangiaceae bacterium]|nr:hypothetical protein [Polyangiaceae bacterium]
MRGFARRAAFVGGLVFAVCGATACSGGDEDAAGAGGAGGSGVHGAGAAGAAGKAAGAAGAAGGLAGAAGAAGGLAGAAGASGKASAAGAAGAGAGGAATGGSAGASGGGAGAGNSGASGSAGQAGCKATADCAGKSTLTTPAGCAEPYCDVSAGACRFRSRDTDGDGHRASKCVANDATPIELGADCDDANPQVSPDGWDGPKGDGKPEHCADGIDQNCSGGDGDQKLSNGASCTCTPGDVVSCSELSNGQPVSFPKLDGTGKPLGACKAGAKACQGDGTWGPCAGTIGPIAESCNSLDDDCDGQTDEGSPPDAPFWSYDADLDLFAPRGWKKVRSCAAPTAPPEECPTCDVSRWIDSNLPATDCDDSILEVNPGASESCNGIDDDCDDKIDDADINVAGQVIRYYDADGDNHGDKTIAGLKTCVAPVAPPSCPSCDPAKWKDSIPNDDCDDTVAEIFPGKAEVCDGYDNNCNGQTDEGATDFAIWWFDGDGDNHAPLGATAKTQCSNPGNDGANCPGGVGPCTGAWKQNLVADDCDDGDALRAPGKAEICDKKDNDCNGSVDDNAASVPQWSYDADADGFSPQGASALTQCFNPGEQVANCPGQTVACPEKWKAAVLPATDCNDLDVTTYPGAWDGPLSAPRAYGFKKPGLTGYFFNGVTSGLPASNAGATQVMTDVHAVDVNLGTGAVSSGVGRDNWAVRYEGTLVVEQAGSYTFHTSTADGAYRLKVNGVTVTDQWAATSTGAVDSPAQALSAGEVPIVLEAYDVVGAFSLRLEWSSASVTRQVVTAVFQPGIGAKPNRCGGDNNCNATLDDSLVVDGALSLSCSSECTPGALRPCGNGVGECKEGVQACDTTGKWAAACDGAVLPTAETCDLKDNDCNGEVDNGITCACANGQTQLCGVCQDGQQTCWGGAWGACTSPDSRVDFCPDLDADGYCWFGEAYAPHTYSGCKEYCANAGAPANQRPPLGENWKLKAACPASGDCRDDAAKGGAAKPGGADEEALKAADGICDNLDNDCDGTTDGGSACLDDVCPLDLRAVEVFPLDRTGSGLDNLPACNAALDTGYSVSGATLKLGSAHYACSVTGLSMHTTVSPGRVDRTLSQQTISPTGWGLPGGCTGTTSNFTCKLTWYDSSIGIDTGILGPLAYQCQGRGASTALNCAQSPVVSDCGGCDLIPSLNNCLAVRVLPKP